MSVGVYSRLFALALVFAAPAALAQSLGTGPGLVVEAASALRQQDWERGVKLAHEALRTGTLKPADMAGTYNNLCVALTALKRYEDALNACNEALVHKPRQWQAHNNRGNVYFELGQSDKALADYYKARAMKPDNKVLRENIRRTLETRKSTRF